MTMRAILLTLVGVVGLGSGVANATDLTPLNQTPFRWEGTYFGVYGGIDVARWPRSGYYDSNDLVNPTANNTGGLVGVQAGWDHMVGNVLIGAVGDLSYLFGEGAMNPASTDSSSRAWLKTDWLGTARLRIGKLIQPNLLAYLTGGLAVGNTTYRTDDGCPSYGCGSESQIQVGGTVGAGLEMQLHDNWTAFGEFQYVMFAGNGFGQPMSTQTGEDFHVTVTPSIALFKFGLNYRLP